MVKTTPEECLKGAKRILGIEKKNNIYELNWPMQVIMASRFALNSLLPPSSVPPAVGRAVWKTLL